MNNALDFTERPTILVVDDTPDNLALMSGLLKDSYKVKVANHGEKALKIAASDSPPDLILLDIMMPDLDGYQVCERLKGDPATRDIPVIFLTAKTEVEDEQHGLALGAVDYITKPFHPSIVRKRVRNHLQSVHHRHLLENLAKIDSLTEIANRRRYDEALESEWRRCARNNSPLSLIIIDVDHFKTYNDQLWHAAGDMILRTIAIALKGFMRRPGDLAARYGGEEFVLLLPQVDAQAASHIAGDIRATVEQMQLAHPASPVSPYVTISLGGMTTQPYDGQVDPQFFRDADAALYAAKARGRNSVVWQTTAG